jgi:hypothetical protein
VTPDLTDADVAIARDRARIRGTARDRRGEALYHDAIAAARRWIYVENQYFTSGRHRGRAGGAARRADGPEIVMVVPRICSGWLEERTMGVARARLVRQLCDADAPCHFAIFHPRLAPNGPDFERARQGDDRGRRRSPASARRT